MKSLLLTVLLTLLTSSVFSQGLFFSAKGGYAVGANRQSDVLRDHEYEKNQGLPSGNGEKHKLSDVPLSYGKGLFFGGSVGYMFSQFIGVDLGFSYLKGSKTTGTTEGYENYYYPNLQPSVRHTKEETTRYGNMFRIMPTLVLSPGLEKWNPYMKVGAIIGIGSYFREVSLLMDGNNFGVPYDPITSFEKEEYKENISFGVNAVVGLEYKWKVNWVFFTEISYEGMSYKPNKSEWIEKTQNGEDVLSNYQKRYTHSTYSNEIEFTPEVDFDAPAPRTRISAPFSNIGFSLGVKFLLLKKE